MHAHTHYTTAFFSYTYYRYKRLYMYIFKIYIERVVNDIITQTQLEKLQFVVVAKKVIYTHKHTDTHTRTYTYVYHTHAQYMLVCVWAVWFHIYNHCTINVVGVFVAAWRLIVDLASSSWLYTLRNLPHLLLAHKVLEVIKEANNPFIASTWIRAKN